MKFMLVMLSAVLILGSILLLALLVLAAVARGSRLQHKRDNFIKYRGGEHTITNIVSVDSYKLELHEPLQLPDRVVIFFNQVDIKQDGERVELGQFVLVNGTAQKIFDGRCSAVAMFDPVVYFGAKDGLYVYNVKTKGADKLGTITDSIVQLQISDTYYTEDIYILTEPDYRIYKVNKEGTEKILVKAIHSAKAFILDRSDNIYYYGENNVPYVLKVGSTEPIQFSSFANVESPILVRPNILTPSGAFFVVREEIYLLYPNGTKELAGRFEEDVRPTSIYMDSIPALYVMDNNIYDVGGDIIWHRYLMRNN